MKNLTIQGITQCKDTLLSIKEVANVINQEAKMAIKTEFAITDSKHTTDDEISNVVAITETSIIFNTHGFDESTKTQTKGSYTLPISLFICSDGDIKRAIRQILKAEHSAQLQKVEAEERARLTMLNKKFDSAEFQEYMELQEKWGNRPQLTDETIV